MNNYFKGNVKYILAILIITIFLGITLGLSYIIQINKGFTIDNEYVVIHENNYKIDINYPVLNIRGTNRKINNFVDEEKRKFLKTIRNDANYENELNINYSYTEKDNLYSIHLRSYSYTGEKQEYYRNDKVFYFDIKKNKEIKITDILKDDKYYEVLRDECLNYLREQKLFDIYDNEQLEEYLNNKGSFDLVLFSNNKIHIIFPPHKVSPYDGEINISVSYDNIKQYLNTKYFNSIKNDLESLDSKKEIEETVERIRNYGQFKFKKIVALTFDDGPGYKKTETLLEEFEKRNVRASFFVLGELAIKQPELVKKAYDMGHTIGSHTYDHKNLKKLNDEQLEYEVYYTNKILSEIIGDEIKYIRPPYGAYNEKILEKVDMSFILWNVDTLDWKTKNADKLAQYLLKNVQDGDIVLMHDIHEETIEGVIKGIDLLKENGFEFVSLDELIAYRHITLETNTAYRHFKLD